jgi:predicted dehydrogenase
MHAKLFSRDERFQLLGLCDVDAERLNAAAAECGNPALYADADKMLAETKPDVFCFCTPPAIRKSLYKLGIDHGVQLIAYEKPMATNFNEARDMMKWRAAGVKTCVSHQQSRRPLPGREGNRGSGKLGRIQSIYGPLWGLVSAHDHHVMDYLRFFIGTAEAEWVWD